MQSFIMLDYVESIVDVFGVLLERTSRSVLCERRTESYLDYPNRRSICSEMSACMP